MSPEDLLTAATEFNFRIYPESTDDDYFDSLAVTVAWRGRDRWAVLHYGYCFDADGEREYESIPSDREDEFKRRFRFDRDEAVRVATEVVVPAIRAVWDQRIARKSGSVTS